MGNLVTNSFDPAIEFPDWEDDGMDDILMGIPRLLCLRCCCYFKGDGVTFFGIGQ